MGFHPDKCSVLTISRNKTPKKFKYCLHDHVLESVDKVNNMRVTISDDLKWESHINNICGKANKTLGFLRRNVNIGSTSVKAQACKSLVRPSLEYACSVWVGNCIHHDKACISTSIFEDASFKML
jgi:hypothetical protein